jgi:hypothetical protein
MMAGRRDRRRPLIRSKALPAITARNGNNKQNPESNNGMQNDRAEVKNSSTSDTVYTKPLSPYTASTAHLELSRYLRQLSALHDVGVLNDDEFLAARRRLSGS